MWDQNCFTKYCYRQLQFTLLGTALFIAGVSLRENREWVSWNGMYIRVHKQNLNVFNPGCR